MSSCKVCHLDSKKHSKKLWKLHQQTQICVFCQKSAGEHSEELWQMHNQAVERGQFCPDHKKKEKLYPITLGFARTAIARVCKNIPQNKPFGTVLSLPEPPNDVDIVPIYMACTECGLYLGSIEEDYADMLGGMCLKCFMELTDLTRWGYGE